MPKKRRNNGRNKNHKGHSDAIHCENCHRLVPKDKAIKRFIIKNMVDGSSKRDIEEMSVYNINEEKYSMPKLYLKNQYCIACGIHARIVRVRSGEDRRIRYISKYRPDQKTDLKKGLYRIANQRGGFTQKRTDKKNEEEA